MAGGARLVWLDQADAQNPALVGAKASRLARARARGLPVLDGFVVPADLSLPALRQGAAALGAGDNSGAARTAVYNHDPPPLLSALSPAGRKLGDSLVVRSSSLAEAEGVWAGAFSSYLGISPEEVSVGVIGCWASVFNPDALNRARFLGMRPAEIGMAVLIQPELSTNCGGVATLGERNQVTVAGMAGHHAPLVAGWESGHVAVVAGDGSVESAEGSPLSTVLLGSVAHLTRRTHQEVGCSHIEWASAQDGKVYLLQAQPWADTRTTGLRQRAPIPSEVRDPRLAGMVRTMLRYPGPVGERLVWPWAIGLDYLPPVRSAHTTRSRAMLVAEIEEGAEMLISQRWPGSEVPETAAGAWERVLRGDASTGREWLSGESTVDLGLARRHLESLGELAGALERDGDLPHPGWLWYLDPDSLETPQVRRESLSRRIGAGRWEHLLYGVVASLGDPLSGHPAAGGWGVGRLRHISTAGQAASFAPREVIVADQPLGNLAPLLWDAAAIVTSGGSPAAHLFEVAKWLGVPAVCGVDVTGLIDGDVDATGQTEDLILAVDGDLGQVAVLF
ncbi:MAG: PEP-utilizing enzyme [bacterium]|nr:PEP-utilizing enzyme [bacterium]MDE0601698.1 PEP-utilizing enzyme [bacterium]